MIKKPKLKSKNNWLDSFEDGGPVDPTYWRNKKPMVNDPSMDAISKVLLFRNQDKNFMQRAAGFGYQGSIPTKDIPDQDPESTDNSNLLMGSGDYDVFPTIIQTGPEQLSYQPLQTEEFITAPSWDVADYFANKGYKRAANSMYGMKYKDGGNLGDPPVNPYAQGMNPLMPNTLVSSTTSAPIKQYNLPVKPIKQEEPKEYSNTYTKFNEKLAPIEKDFISIKDTRKIQPVTLKPINPNTDLKTGNYDYGNIQRVIGAAKFVGVPPDLALAITMTENGIGKNDDNFGHVLSGWLPNVDKKINELDEETINKYSYPALQLAYAMQEKIKNPNDLKSIQSYNGTKNLTPNTEKGMEGSGNKNGVKSWYGVDVTKQPLNAGKVLPFAKTVKSIQDSVINTNPQIQQLIKNGKLKNGGWLNNYASGGDIEPEDPVNPYAQGQNPLMPQTLVSTNPTIKILSTTQELQKNQLDKVIEKNNSNRPALSPMKKEFVSEKPSVWQQKMLQKQKEANTLGNRKVTFNQFGDPVLEQGMYGQQGYSDPASGKVDVDYMDPITMGVTMGAGAYGKGLNLADAALVGLDWGTYGASNLGKNLGKAGFNALKNSTESGILRNTYKINPWKFKANPENLYRQIGDGVDALESGVIRSADQGTFPRPYFVEGKDFEMLKTTGSGANRKNNMIAEMPMVKDGEMTAYQSHVGNNYSPYQANLKEIPLSDVKLYKQDWLQGYKQIKTPKPNVSSSVDDVVQPVTPQPWQMQELPGLHLKSTMSDGAISKIVEPKTGLVNTEQALAIIGKESGGADKVAIVRQGLGNNIPKKMDFNEFRKVVQDQLIPLERQFVDHSSDYGIKRLGYKEPEFITRTVNGKTVNEMSSDVIENQTLILSNKNKFGRGSDAHSNPEETLGHIHFLIDAETPDIITATQIQSDAFQSTHRIMSKDSKNLTALERQQKSLERMEELQQRNRSVLNKMKIEGVDEAGVPVQEYQIKQFEDLVKGQESQNLMKKAEVENFSQKSLLDKNHQERYLQELVDYAGKRGDVNKVRVPTSETAAKVQGYSKNTASGMDEMGLPTTLDFSSEHKTILKKYSEQPKTIKKLFGKEPTIVTDSKGNTWYEFDIPQKFKKGKGEIKALTTAGTVLGAGALTKDKKQNGGWLNNYK